MPKVSTSNAKGLLQQSGTGFHPGNIYPPVSSPTGTSTQLTNADSGKVIFMDASSANTITLPAVASTEAGWHIKVILTATGALGKIVTSGSENKITGIVNAVDADGSTQTVTQIAAGDTISFVDACLAGSYVEICSNGTLFYAYGFGTHATASNKMTIVQAG